MIELKKRRNIDKQGKEERSKEAILFPNEERALGNVVKLQFNQ